MKSKNIVLGVTGSIAAHKAADLASQLTKKGADVRVVLTADAQRFITALPFKTLSRHAVVTDLYDEEEGWQPAHIKLADQADLLLIAPATANIIGKVAAGIADDALTSVLMALDCPVVMAPDRQDERRQRGQELVPDLEVLRHLAAAWWTTRFLGRSAAHPGGGQTRGMGEGRGPVRLRERIRPALPGAHAPGIRPRRPGGAGRDGDGGGDPDPVPDGEVERGSHRGNRGRRRGDPRPAVHELEGHEKKEEENPQRDEKRRHGDAALPSGRPDRRAGASFHRSRC